MHGDGAPIERREESVAGRIDFRAGKPLKLASDDLVMAAMGRFRRHQPTWAAVPSGTERRR